jgi:hypothetical protein
MPARYWFRLAEISVAFLLALAVYFSWRADRRDRSQLESELAATKQLLVAADARQHDRDAQLAKTLATLAAKKRAIVTPAQIVRELPSQIPPAVSHRSATHTGVAKSAIAPNQSRHPRRRPEAYVRLRHRLQGLPSQAHRRPGRPHRRTRENTSLTHERDDALRIARGGSLLRRIGRAAKWFLIGAAAGAVAAKAAH